MVGMLVESFYRFVPNNYTVKNKNIQNNYKNNEVLIFGNSHTFYGLNPDFFTPKTFNISNISQSLYFDELLFHKHIDSLPHLKYVILNVEYTSLSQKPNTSEDVWRKYFYKAQMNLDVPIIQFYDLKQYSLATTRSFKMSLNTIEEYYKNKTIVQCNEKGWGTGYSYQNRMNNIPEIAKITVVKHEDGLSDFTANTKRIQSIIEKCNEKNIKVLLVTMPVSSAYASGVNQTKLASIFETCTAIVDNNTNASYLNLFKDSRFNEDDFFDPDHLNDKGAEKCSQIVDEILDLEQ